MKANANMIGAGQGFYQPIGEVSEVTRPSRSQRPLASTSKTRPGSSCQVWSQKKESQDRLGLVLWRERW